MADEPERHVLGRIGWELGEHLIDLGIRCGPWSPDFGQLDQTQQPHRVIGPEGRRTEAGQEPLTLLLHRKPERAQRQDRRHNSVAALSEIHRLDAEGKGVQAQTGRGTASGGTLHIGVTRVLELIVEARVVHALEHLIVPS